MNFEVEEQCIDSLNKRQIGFMRIEQGDNPHIEKPDMEYYSRIENVFHEGVSIKGVKVEIKRLHSVTSEEILKIVDGVRTLIESKLQKHGSTRQTFAITWDKIYGCDYNKNPWCLICKYEI